MTSATSVSSQWTLARCCDIFFKNKFPQKYQAKRLSQILQEDCATLPTSTDFLLVSLLPTGVTYSGGRVSELSCWWWHHIQWPIVNYSLHSADKADIPAEIHKYLFYELCDQYADYCRIYTDGSKAGERVASAIVYKGITKNVRLPDLTSIFRAELYALFQAIDVIRRSKFKKIRNFLRFAI